jgi:hypothetical protein
LPEQELKLMKKQRAAGNGVDGPPGDEDEESSEKLSLASELGGCSLVAAMNAAACSRTAAMYSASVSVDRRPLTANICCGVS